MELEELPGVGEATAEKLREAGYATAESIAAAEAGELSDVAGIGESAAEKIIKAAKQKIQLSFMTGSEVLEKRKSMKKITTGSKVLNGLLGGGIETQAITEFFGEFGSGKTQLCHQLAVNVQLPEEGGGLGKNVVYIDTENTFRPERIIQMSEPLGLEEKITLDNTVVARAYNSDHQVLAAEKLDGMIKEKNIGLIVVDSLTSHFRSDYAGRGMLADRQQKLNRHMHNLLKLAEMHNLAVVVTNQVMARPDFFFGDPTAPIGGHVVGHASTFRIYLRKAKGGKRMARLIDSPSLPEGEALFAVTKEGVKD
ncbi:MAG: DNA repair and recombination protein RadA [Candidatus Hydrothermarchaeota archaeon]|nr:DNA repair and recombination protein RadA [Candidatus Hydrothermarchaeota archaeon]